MRSRLPLMCPSTLEHGTEPERWPSKYTVTKSAASVSPIWCTSDGGFMATKVRPLWGTAAPSADVSIHATCTCRAPGVRSRSCTSRSTSSRSVNVCSCTPSPTALLLPDFFADQQFLAGAGDVEALTLADPV